MDEGTLPQSQLSGANQSLLLGFPPLHSTTFEGIGGGVSCATAELEMKSPVQKLTSEIAQAIDL